MAYAGQGWDALRALGDRLRSSRVPPATADATPARLVLVGPGEERAYPLTGSGPWWVGRGATADVRLEDPTVSRHHLRVRRDGRGYSVEQARRATNPGKLDAVALRPGLAVPLQPGAVLAAGRSRLVFQPPRPA